MAWDSTASDSVMSEDSTATVVVSGLNGPFTWVVVGNRFSLQYAETSGVSNILISDATASGTATITVTGCDLEEVQGTIKIPIFDTAIGLITNSAYDGNWYPGWPSVSYVIPSSGSIPDGLFSMGKAGGNEWEPWSFLL